ncbi:hypothetical protein J6590_059286 [Homalodisca vitripennis]|nr:hypothetical protein J6590_059286 [Homalodisca vitripennis]
MFLRKDNKVILSAPCKDLFAVAEPVSPLAHRAGFGRSYDHGVRFENHPRNRERHCHIPAGAEGIPLLTFGTRLLRGGYEGVGLHRYFRSPGGSWRGREVRGQNTVDCHRPQENAICYHSAELSTG